MPAHRSSAEADIRNDVVSHLREHWPSARIIHEINAAGQGTNRIDVLAVARESILSVEIKSKKDKLDRLPRQYRAMQRVSNYSFAALHEKFLVTLETNKWASWWTDDQGIHWRKDLPDTVPDLPRHRAWIWPRVKRVANPSEYDSLSKWMTPAPSMSTALPSTALNILWAGELRQLCHELNIGVGPRTTMIECVRLLRWQATGKEVTRGICRALRRRDCIEADAPIEDDCGAG